MFTLYWTQMFYDGLRNHSETDFALLPRAGWVGTWRHGAALWSGDIGGTMEVLKSQVNIGLSAQTSGIPWWTTDIGGYAGMLIVAGRIASELRGHTWCTPIYGL